MSSLRPQHAIKRAGASSAAKSHMISYAADMKVLLAVQDFQTLPSSDQSAGSHACSDASDNAHTHHLQSCWTQMQLSSLTTTISPY